MSTVKSRARRARRDSKVHEAVRLASESKDRIYAEMYANNNQVIGDNSFNLIADRASQPRRRRPRRHVTFVSGGLPSLGR